MRKDQVVFDKESYPIAMDEKVVVTLDGGLHTVVMSGDRNINPNDIQTIIKFLVSKLSSADLEELDGMLTGETKEEPMAADARLGSDQERRDWLRMGPAARNAVRRTRVAHVAMDAASERSFAERFPDANRLRIG